jgi:hypothetical protein
MRLIRSHWALAVVLALAVAVRAGVAIAYRPAIFFGDSWAYLDLAYNGSPVGLAPDRPSGYPLLIDLLSLTGRSLVAITTVQHLAGLVVGVLVYALLLRLGLPRLLAAAAAAVALLDGYAIALEQQILAETFFALALTASMYLAVGRRGPAALAASGLLLAAAATMRTVALFAIPVWVVYVLWVHGRGRAAARAPARLLEPACRQHRALRPRPGGRLVPLRKDRPVRRLRDSRRPPERAHALPAQCARPPGRGRLPCLER